MIFFKFRVGETRPTVMIYGEETLQGEGNERTRRRKDWVKKKNVRNTPVRRWESESIPQEKKRG